MIKQVGHRESYQRLVAIIGAAIEMDGICTVLGAVREALGDIHDERMEDDEAYDKWVKEVLNMVCLLSVLDVVCDFADIDYKNASCAEMKHKLVTLIAELNKINC